MKSRTRLALASLTSTAVVVVAFLVPTTPAIAHGTMSDPASRVYTCKNEGPETPKSDACKAAVAAGGTQAYYDWNEVSLLEAGGRHRQLIPDGKLCSAGRDKYRGLDLQRADWPAKRVTAGPLTVTYHASAPHSNSNFEFYLTRDGWDPTQPLRWSDLVHLQTFNGQNPSTFTNWTLNLPGRSGRHILYSIWQRVVGSNEAFYTCSDVDFGGGSTPPPTTTTTTPPPTTTTTTPPPVGGTWAAGTTYSIGNRVTYNGVNYECQLAHTALAGWEPPNTPALWRRL
ncbi:lytic polysaccharide monooxygenase [Lentzea sp. BCCO 10_0061]|uniref:Lytic polysaccharide monooxygenase n=1 Tax=Lentzea sokolovensis TaxID=3095429 RepID=A0ABU4URY7_9PSEU|nr:lytic polysaccharide monooxygenase [Lentzea sp. BCCO 10_0061]MDX8142252.1 lytic polysaccharide monooxygenase [Lentzea sp. BCCO 10_0061]